MKLSNARLCLDCDEIHEDDHCPVCVSESFAFIKRWVTTPERAVPPAAVAKPPSETVATYRALLGTTSADGQPATTSRLLRGGALGLAVLGAAGWILHRSKGLSGKTEQNLTPEPPS